MGKHVFCRDLTLERGEPLVGTGNLSERFLALRWPRGAWRVPRFESVGMSEALQGAVQRGMKAGLHIALVDRVGETDALPALLGEGIAADYADEASLIAAIEAFAEGRPLVGRPDPRQMILVCTDSRRDACCARYGFATYKDLVAAADPARFNVLQATHLGGCRFAATIVVLPQRQRYGRIEPSEVGAFLAAIGRDELYLPGYRGRAGLPAAAQVAEHAALSWVTARGEGQAPVRLLHDPLPEAELADERLTLTAEVGSHRLAITLVSEIYTVHGRCTAIGEQGELQPRWRLESVTVLA